VVEEDLLDVDARPCFSCTPHSYTQSRQLIIVLMYYRMMIVVDVVYSHYLRGPWYARVPGVVAIMLSHREGRNALEH
jgi:hypothetical protein